MLSANELRVSAALDCHRVNLPIVARPVLTALVCLLCRCTATSSYRNVDLIAEWLAPGKMQVKLVANCFARCRSRVALCDKWVSSLEGLNDLGALCARGHLTRQLQIWLTSEAPSETMEASVVRHCRFDNIVPSLAICASPFVWPLSERCWPLLPTSVLYWARAMLRVDYEWQNHDGNNEHNTNWTSRWLLFNDIQPKRGAFWHCCSMTSNGPHQGD